MSQRPSVYLSFSSADTQTAVALLRAHPRLRLSNTDALRAMPAPATPPPPRRPRLSYIVDAEGRMKYISAYSATVLDYREVELLGMSAITKLRPDLDEKFRGMVLANAQACPDEWVPMPDTYVLARDEHHVELVNMRVRWSTRTETLLVEGDVNRADDDRVRRLGPQFIEPVERERMAAFLQAREEQRAARLEELLAKAEQQFVPKPEDKGEGELRRYPDRDELRRDLYAVFDTMDPWTMRVSDVCKALPRHISANSLALHFDRFGWLKRGSLKESLRDMAIKYANDQGRGFDHLGGAAAVVVLGGLCRLMPHLHVLAEHIGHFASKL